MTTTHRKRPIHHSQRRRVRYVPPPRPTRFRWWWLAFTLLMIPFAVYVSWLDVQIREQFEGKSWELPARVYASPLEIYSGMRLDPAMLDETLQALGYRASEQLYEPGQYQRNANEFVLKTRAFQFWDAQETPRTIKIDFKNNEIASVRQVDPPDNIALVRLEPRLIGKIYPTHNEDRILVRLDEVHPLLVKALITMEDRSFYSHFGVSIKGLLRASVENFKAGEWIQGGSTITQQLVKNLYLTPERTLNRKVNEAVMALLLEWHYTKDQILQAYLNEVYLGQDGDRAIHGIGMASQFYFNRPLNELSLSEMALLVSLTRGASVYNPRKHPERVLERRNLVLSTIAEQKIIMPEEATIAQATPLGITEEITDSVSPYPAFLELVRRQLREDYRETDLQSEGLQIFTTLDPLLQKTAEEAMIKGIQELERWNRRTRQLQGAMVVSGSENGEVLAFVNGRDPRYAGYNRPLNALRQIGSLVKVSIYLSALESNKYSLATMLDDSPYEWKDRHTGASWSPQNYDFRSHGRIPLHVALANSYNLATVRLGMQLGLDKVRETLRRMGIEREFKIYPSMLLGSVSLTPLEVTQMYHTLASGGFHMPLRAIREVLTHEGKPLQRYALSVQQNFDSAPIYLLNYALQRAVRYGTGRKVAKKFPENMILAGKTGTSNDLRDSWFAGFDSDLLTVTWLGRDDNKSIGLSGGSGAMHVWGNFMQAVRPQSLAPVTPGRVQWRWVDQLQLPFIVGSVPEMSAFTDTSEQTTY